MELNMKVHAKLKTTSNAMLDKIVDFYNKKALSLYPLKYELTRIQKGNNTSYCYQFFRGQNKAFIYTQVLDADNEITSFFNYNQSKEETEHLLRDLFDGFLLPD